MPSAFDEEIKLLEKWERKDPHVKRQYAEWRRIWKLKGPVKFAHEVLKRDPESGGPLILSEDQIEFLLDMSKRGVRLAIITAGRGAGKTFVLAVYVIWRIFTHEYWGMSCMGGSAEQSAKIHKYVSFWMRECKELKPYGLKPTMKKVSTYSHSYALFLSCSATSVRGPHTVELIIDEQAAGEERGGTKQIKAALGQVTTSPDIHIIKSSTAQYVHGDFLETWNNATKKGYKKYQWAIAKHINGEKDPYRTFKDQNPNNWVSNVPWILDLNIRIARDNMSDDEWLVEALGGISKTSGLVFNPRDLDACICTRCPQEYGKPCRPYKDGYCPIVQYYMHLEGVPQKKIPLDVKKCLQKVGQRMMGIDWGRDAPCAYTVVGKFKRMAFVLESQELVGQSDDEKVSAAIGKYNEKGRLIEGGLAQRWSIDTIRPDPEEWSFNNTLAGKGFSVHVLFAEEGAGAGPDKASYVHTLKKFVERHRLVIPSAFGDLIRSLRNASYKAGKIRKRDDHSFDSLLYAISYYGEIDEQIGFWKAIKEDQGKTTGKETDTERTAREKQEKENLERSGDKDIEIVDDVAEWARKKKWQNEERSDDEEFPWGEGVDLW